MDKFTVKMFFRLWWPTILGSIGFIVDDLIDSIVLGQDTGTTGLAAVSLCGPIFQFTYLLAWSLGLGGATKFSTLMGEGKVEEAKKSFNDVLKTGLIVTVILAALGYIFIDPLLVFLGADPAAAELYRATEDYVVITVLGTPLYLLVYVLEYYLNNDNLQKVSNLASSICAAFTLILTAVMVVMLHMGAAGAALAPLLAIVIELCIEIPVAMSRYSHLHFTDWKIDFKGVWTCFRNGFSINISFAYQTAVFLGINNFLMRTMGEAGVAIFDLTQSLQYIFIHMQNGTYKAMAPLVSMYVGERYRAGIEQVKSLNWRYCLGISCFIAVLVVQFPAFFCDLFGYDDAATMEAAYEALRISAVGSIIGGVFWSFANYYQALGDDIESLHMSTIRNGAALIPSFLFFAFVLPEYFWYMFPAAEVLTIIMYLIWRKVLSRHVVASWPESKILVLTAASCEEEIKAALDKVMAFCLAQADTAQSIARVQATTKLCLELLLKYCFAKSSGYIQITLVEEKEGHYTLHVRDTAKACDVFTLATEEEKAALAQNSQGSFYRRYQGFNSLTVSI